MAPSTIIVQGLFRKPFFLKCQLFCQNGFHLWKMRWLMILWNVTNILTVVWFYFLSLFYIATKSPLLMFLTPVYSFGSSARVLPLFVAVSFHEKITFHSAAAAAAIMSSSTLRVEELDDENRQYVITIWLKKIFDNKVLYITHFQNRISLHWLISAINDCAMSLTT